MLTAFKIWTHSPLVLFLSRSPNLTPEVGTLRETQVIQDLCEVSPLLQAKLAAGSLSPKQFMSWKMEPRRMPYDHQRFLWSLCLWCRCANLRKMWDHPLKLKEVSRSWHLRPPLQTPSKVCLRGPKGAEDVVGEDVVAEGGQIGSSTGFTHEGVGNRKYYGQILDNKIESLMGKYWTIKPYWRPLGASGTKNRKTWHPLSISERFT